MNYWNFFSKQEKKDFRVSIFLKLPEHVPITVEMSKLWVEKGGRDPTAL